MAHASAQDFLIARLIETEGILVRSSSDDSPFWYTSGRPGPFYVNTQNIAGNPTSDRMLEAITNTLKSELSAQEQAEGIWNIVMNEVRADKAYEESIDRLVEYYRAHEQEAITVISGGERRDWFFSIPMAAKLGLPHAFLLKAGGFWYRDAEGNFQETASLQGETVLHVADIINQASSYTRAWLPILRDLGVTLKQTLTVAVRNQEGLDVLEREGVKVICPVTVDITLFEKAHELKLIPEFAYNEISLYYQSAKDWTRKLLTDSPAVLLQNAKTDDAAKAGRIHTFATQDAYELQGEFQGLFEELRTTSAR